MNAGNMGPGREEKTDDRWDRTGIGEKWEAPDGESAAAWPFKYPAATFSFCGTSGG